MAEVDLYVVTYVDHLTLETVQETLTKRGLDMYHEVMHYEFKTVYRVIGWDLSEQYRRETEVK